MKNFKIIIFSIIMLVLNINNVSAKDTVYSLNKYNEEKFTIIQDSYNSSGKKDGLIIAGNVLKETYEENDEKYKDYQVILVKYNKNGKAIWTFTYGKNREDDIDYLTYTYNENNEIDGYLIVMEKTYDAFKTSDNVENILQEETNNSQTTYIKVGLNGKLVWEKTSNLNNYEKITKIVPIYNEENIFDGYIAIGNIIKDNKQEKSILVKYSKNLDVIWSKEYTNNEYSEITNVDLTPVYQDNKLTSYVLIRKLTKDKEVKTQLIKYDLDGNEVKIINEELSNHNNLKLEKANNGFILYGLTSEVKIKKGEKSYLLIKYNLEGEEEWETVGNTPTDSNKKVILVPITKDNKIDSYFILYNNKADSSFEIVKLNNEGLIEKKVKKIKNDYYDFENFYTINDTLYFIGQINCPEDDNCDYDSNSLFLVSDEDKVIEVEEENNTSIVVVMVAFCMLIVLGVLVKRKRKLK